jgi:molecular chaperone DnaK
MTAAMKLGEAIYGAQQAEGEAAAAAEGDDVVDADFEEVDGDDRASA